MNETEMRDVGWSDDYIARHRGDSDIVFQEERDGVVLLELRDGSRKWFWTHEISPDDAPEKQTDDR